MGIGKIAGNAVYHAAAKAAKSPVLKGAAMGAAGVATVSVFKNHNGESDKKTKAAVALGTLAGGAAILFLAGKSTGASNKQALSAGLNMAKTGIKNLVNSAKATPIGQKISNFATSALNKAKSLFGKIKENPKMQAAAGKIKEAAGKVKNNPKVQAAAGKAGEIKGAAMEKASKLKGAASEKIKSAAGKVKEAAIHAKENPKVQAAGQKAGEIKSVVTEKAGKLKNAAGEKLAQVKNFFQEKFHGVKNDI